MCDEVQVLMFMLQLCAALCWFDIGGLCVKNSLLHTLCITQTVHRDAQALVYYSIFTASEQFDLIPSSSVALL